MKLFTQITSLWLLLMIVVGIYGEYIISRDVDSILQTISTLIVLICIFGTFKLTLKLITNKK